MKSTFLIALIVTYLLVALLMFLAKKDRGTKNNAVQLHPIYLIVGLFGFVAFSVFEICSIFAQDLLASVGFMVFVLLLVSLIVAYFNCRLYFYDTYVIRQNFFRVRKRIDYDEFVSIKKENGTVYLRTENSKIKISQYMGGKREFFKALKPYKSKIQNLNDVPLGKVPKVLKYKDAVNDYAGFVFAIVVYVFFEILTLLLFGLELFYFHRMDGVVFWGCCFALVSISHFLIVQSAKRHHSSKFWAFVAKYFYKKGYLKDPYNRKKEDPWTNL